MNQINISYLYRILITIFYGIVAASCSSTADFVLYKNPGAEYITLQGTIDDKYSYSYAVGYQTNSEQKMCMNYGMNTGWRPSYKGFEYFPTIEKDRYKILLPLMELDPNTACRWLPAYVRLCAKTKSQPRPQFSFNCTILFYTHEVQRDGYYEISNPMDVYCDSSYRCLSLPYFPPKNFYIKEYKRNYTINISTKPRK